MPLPSPSPSNRTPDRIERLIIDLAHAHPQIGSRQIANLCRIICGFQLSHQTVRNILKRNSTAPTNAFVAMLIWLFLFCRRLFDGLFQFPKKARSVNVPHNCRHRMTKSDELEIVRLHATQLDAPLRKIRDQINLLLGTNFATRNISKAISRNRKLLERLLGKKPRKFSIHRPRELWGIDITEVRVFFLFRVQVLGVIDYFGSRLIVLQPLKDVKSETIISALQDAFPRNGKPERFISDNGSVFRGEEFRDFLRNNGIKHTFTRPAHPWTNGRIERLFRTFKEMIVFCYPIILGNQQLISFCAEFIVYYNEARPHSAWNDRTPDEVYFHQPRSRRATPTTFFEGRLKWYRFGY